MIHDKESLILIVDDSPMNTQILGNMLDKNGYKLAMAKNGMEALDYVNRKLPDLILLDIMMPEMDGFEACTKLKQIDSTKNIPILFITALSSISDKLKAFEAGGLDYITKPFIEEEVLARVKVHINLRKVMEKLEHLSVKDDLTGAFNRRFAYEVLDKKMNNAKRTHDNFALCYMDIDNLKKVNDNFGHSLGDQLINTFVYYLNDTIRSSDYVFRMGGDEFLILFPNTNLEESKILMKRLQDRLNERNINNLPLDFSLGFTEYRYNEDVGTNQLIERADAKMYEEKLRKKKERYSESL